MDEHKGKDLRHLPKNLRDRFPDVPRNSKICWKCRKLKDPRMTTETADVMQEKSFDESGDMDEDVNKASLEHNDSPCTNSSLDRPRSQREIEFEEMVDGLKEKFSSLHPNHPDKLRILTILPSAWSARKIADEFCCSRRLAGQAIELKKSKGVLSCTTAKQGKPLPKDTVEAVIRFYESDSNSRVMPGVKDVVSVKIDDERTLMQKRLLQYDLRGLFLKFKETFEDIKISFSKFAQIRPKQCILAGSHGTHCVCVCTMHQNCKLMLDAIDVQSLTEKSEPTLITYKDCLQQMICDESTASCYFDECPRCPESDELAKNLLQILQRNNIFDVKFSTWTSTDRSTLITQLLSSEDFVQQLVERLEVLKPHSFVSKQQSEYFQSIKNTLPDDVVLVTLDFSENYKYVAQDASQAFHFNNDQ